MEYTRGVEHQAFNGCRPFRLFPFVSVCVASSKVVDLLIRARLTTTTTATGERRHKRTQTETNGKDVCDYGPEFAEVRRGAQGERGVFGWQLKQL
jgi:hypothetical protein